MRQGRPPTSAAAHAPIGSAAKSDSVADRIMAWQVEHGRSDLPWQRNRDPYRVWLSEIMLQQTQVATVRDYFERFVARFPDIRALAAASADDVLALWSGLGYYSRARNLHRCAQLVVASHGGEFPRSAKALEALPGVGRSTAAAIAAFCFGERVAILDGNVKRVLTRWLGFDLDLAVPANERALWDRADDLLPRQEATQHMPRYTQALMDLGATVCHIRNPACTCCPLAADCIARHAGDAQRYPVKTRKLARRRVDWWLLLLRDETGRIWLVRRPDRGIWAGLYCLPVFERREALDLALAAHDEASAAQELAPFSHVLTHRDLLLHPVAADVHSRDWPGSWRVAEPASLATAPQSDGRWAASAVWAEYGLPTPVRKLLDSLSKK